MSDDFSFYKEYPKTCRDDDFWGQVKRTVNGKSVSEEQISMIVSACSNALNLNKNDELLDLCCGNGALTDRLFNYCHGGLGVDFSEHLIGIANKYFNKSPERQYLLKDVAHFFVEPYRPEKYTKVLCYGAFSYLEQSRAELVLSQLHQKFVNVTHVFIGNCPDKKLSNNFYSERNLSSQILDDPSSAIGIWRTKEEFTSLSEKCGWKVTFSKMPPEYYAVDYRYDVELTREL